MNRLLILPVLLLTLLVGNPAVSADFQKGVDAAQKGDFATALKEWKPLAEQGDASAQYNLGVMYKKGQGVIQDNVYAHMWASLAEKQGHGKGARLRDHIEEEMSPPQLITAQKLARECVKKNYKGC